MVSATSLTGAAGEHFVMSELLRRGMIAALAPAGVPNCDIVVTDDIGERLCAVQVKTRRGQGAARGWHVGKKIGRASCRDRVCTYGENKVVAVYLKKKSKQ